MGGRRSWNKSSKKKKKTKREKRKDQTLLDFPSDLLPLIISYLPLKDNIRASTVCKKLHEVCVSVRVADTSPWLIYFSKINDGSYELYDPSTQKSYNLESPEILGFRICYSKDGWLLMYNPNTQQLLFFNPFTRDRIPVPSLWMAYDQRIAFSCAPTSTSCLLFTVNNFALNYISVKTWSPNAEEWTESVSRERLPQNFDRIERIVYANGVFFCLTESGCLSIFCPSLKIWSFFPGRALKYPESNGCFMTEHQGKIFLVYTYNNHMDPTVFRLDDTSLEWNEVKTLGGLTIYASALSSESRAEQNQPSGIKNCLCLSVYHGFKRTCVYYKVYEERLISFKWKNLDPYANIWINPPLNLLDLPFV